MKKKHIRTSVFRVCILFAVCISLSVGIIGFATYYHGMIDKYQKYIAGILNISMCVIDGDSIRLCIEEGAESGRLVQEQEFLNKIKDNYEITYIYITKPLNLEDRNNMMYVLAGVAKEEIGDKDNVKFGDLSGEEYDAKVVSHYMSKMEDSQDISYYANWTNFGFMYTGLATITDSMGQAVAVLSVDISVNELAVTFWNYLGVVLVGSAVITIVFLLLMYQWMNVHILIPLYRMETSAKCFVDVSHLAIEPEQMLFCDPKVHTNDEMEVLADTLMVMAEDLKVYMKKMLSQRAEKERIESELTVAAQIQANMLPCIFPAFPERKEIDIYAMMIPAKEVGGDFYDFFWIDDRHFFMVMADVSGKGIPAALFMMIGKTLIKDHVGAKTSLTEVFGEVNRLLYEANKEGLFITAFACVLDVVTGELRFVNAGHEKPYFLYAKKGVVAYPVCASFVLALMEEGSYEEGSVILNPDDKIFLYTDGVTEATNELEKLYGSDRLSQILNQNQDKPPKELLGLVKADVDQFVGRAAQFDDLTMLCMEYKARGGKLDEGIAC